ncbi:MAG TPA: pyridoxal phosphate-dependent aminotransferase, partial [Puia sp.]|nr:pyridoxal phosphate-dependent aminotransferase [Puia sp.]
DLAALRSLVSDRTKYISVTTPHNPTGVCLGLAQLRQLADLAEERGIYLLVDETYRDMVFGEQLPLAATLSPRVISVSSLSKTYGLPGLRIGWLVCGDPQLLGKLLAAKEQMHICGPVIDEEIAYRYWQHRDRYLPGIRADIQLKFGLVKEWMRQQNDFEWVEPQGGCVCFPRLLRPQEGDLARFYCLLLKQYGTYVAPGHWFDFPEHYLRIGFGWPPEDRLTAGLTSLTSAWKSTVSVH